MYEKDRRTLRIFLQLYLHVQGHLVRKDGDHYLGAVVFVFILYLLHLYPGFYSYTEGATRKILDLLTETLLI